MLLNDGPQSRPNPSISFMVICQSAEETEKYWQALLAGGQVLMPLDTYDWSPKYGWLQDKYGVSWQLYQGELKDGAQKFSPTMMFTGDRTGKAEEALRFYVSVFSQSRVEGVLYYSEGDGDKPGLVKHAQFTLKDYVMMAMDSSLEHGFSFNDALSIVVECEDQAEIDSYWNQLTANGGQEVACGWLTDKYGISWQILPKGLGKLMSDPEKGQRAMQALMKMKKLIIADLENA
jgi:predicted 3-demethylubiquinone-9 3-methyltransferase (glyoxalase superfamily)